MSINHVLLARIVDLFLHTNTEFYAYTSWSHLNSMETKCIGRKSANGNMGRADILMDFHSLFFANSSNAYSHKLIYSFQTSII